MISIAPPDLLKINMCMQMYLHPLHLRNDKYSKKVFKFFVEYADKEAVRKSKTEIEKASTQEEAHEMI